MERLNGSIEIAMEMLSLRSDPARGSTREPNLTAVVPTPTGAGDTAKYQWPQDSSIQSQPSPAASDDGSQPQDTSFGYPGQWKRSSAKDPNLTHHYTSSYAKSSAQQGLYPNSPSQSTTSSRYLNSVLSPSTLNHSSATSISLPPISPVTQQPFTNSPHTAHLQELQHQLSTKSLAHQILLGEHDKLLSAYSRSQTRCSALDKKSQVSDGEINNLAEDKIRLQAQVDDLETQVEELQVSRDAAQKQSVASGQQYLQIMAMSGKLQTQSAAEREKWRIEREKWAQERQELVLRIAELEKRQKRGDQGTKQGADNVESSDEEGPEQQRTGMRAGGQVDLSTSTCLQQLRDENARLREGKIEVEAVLAVYKVESRKMSSMISELGGIDERLRQMELGNAPVE